MKIFIPTTSITCLTTVSTRRFMERKRRSYGWSSMPPHDGKKSASTMECDAAESCKMICPRSSSDSGRGRLPSRRTLPRCTAGARLKQGPYLPNGPSTFRIELCTVHRPQDSPTRSRRRQGWKNRLHGGSRSEHVHGRPSESSRQ